MKDKPSDITYLDDYGSIVDKSLATQAIIRTTDDQGNRQEVYGFITPPLKSGREPQVS